VSVPFKRYQIQPVWRADRPQKGRYREFYQCDADVVGTSSLICEAEIILMIRDVFRTLNITDYTIKINHRGVLNGVAELIGTASNPTALFVAIDKLDKIGEEKVREELAGKGLNGRSLDLLFEMLNVGGSTPEKIAVLRERFKDNAPGLKGVADIETVMDLLKSSGSDDAHVEFDIPLARGLSYYTGCIFEVKINNVAIGSVSGGGRYDNLTQAFGDKENLSGIGFSFGVDRIYDAMEELKVFPKKTQISSNVLVCHFDEASLRYGLRVLSSLRTEGIACEIYPDISKIKKQLDYANKKRIPFALVIGSDEMSSGLIALKNLETGEQEKFYLNQIIDQLRS
jgi:histidyl-tRNA synthetase